MMFMNDNLTEKKTARYMNQRNKRFTRKRSQQCDKLSQSRRSSIQQFAGNHYIKTPSGSKRTLILQQNQFFKTLAADIIKHDVSPIKKIQHKQNYIAKLQALSIQIDIKNNEYENIRIQNQRISQCLIQEKQKRRKLESQKKQVQKQLNTSKKDYQKLQMENKRINKEKEYYLRQIQFLQKINFDEKTRTLQSYREKYLQNQVEKLRELVKKSKNDQEKKLQEEINFLKEEKYNLQSHYKALKLANQCLIKQIAKNNQQCRDFILNSEEYVKLRDKYKKFLDEYKALRTQYWALKQKITNPMNNESSLLSITFSECDEKSRLM